MRYDIGRVDRSLDLARRFRFEAYFRDDETEKLACGRLQEQRKVKTVSGVEHFAKWTQSELLRRAGRRQRRIRPILDFVRSSLGLCKHPLVVLEDLATSACQWRGGLEQQRLPEHALPELCWDWLRRWIGEGDRLAGLRWRGASEAAPHGKGARAPAWRTALQDKARPR